VPTNVSCARGVSRLLVKEDDRWTRAFKASGLKGPVSDDARISEQSGVEPLGSLVGHPVGCAVDHDDRRVGLEAMKQRDALGM
jgi:hypothetical protein